MNDRSQDPSAIPSDLAQIVQDLQTQLNDTTQDPRPFLWKLAVIYNRTHQPEPAMACLRRLLALESDLEKQAACILALGQSMEQLGDWTGAIRFYREALALEPINNDTWYFIHNNLGYCHNQLGDFAEGEKCCRAALRINPGRPNAYKNLGIALSGQGHYPQAASCYLTGTINYAGDPRSFHLLQTLMQDHPELEFEFGESFARCGRHVTFAQLARQRAINNRPFRVLLGLENSSWLNLCGHALFALSGGAIQVVQAKSLSEFIQLGENESFHLAIAAPATLPTGVDTQTTSVSPWHALAGASTRWRQKTGMGVFAAGAAEEIAKHSPMLKQAGVMEIFETNTDSFPLMDAVMRQLEKAA